MILLLMTETPELNSPVAVPQAADLPRDRSRRLTRTATLDCSASIYDGGYSDADRTFTLSLEAVSRDDGDTLSRWLQWYGTLLVATREGVFSCAPQRITETTMTLLVKQKLA